MRQRSLRVTAVLVALVVLAGCATIPTSGPVVSEPRQVFNEGQGGITVVPEPPPQGAPPATIVRGFLLAMASFDPTYATAKAYLTADAAKAWQPTSEVLIYGSGATPQVTGDQVSISALSIGRVSADGSFTGSEETQWKHDFGMVQEDGEWRISNPPTGLALSQDAFSSSFKRINAYFFPESSQVLVPDPRYVQSGAWDRTRAANLVLAGPSDWLSTIMGESVFSGISLTGDVTRDPGVADIPLSDAARSLSLKEAWQLAVEIAATMRDVTGVTGVRLMVDGTPLTIPGAAPDGSLPISIVGSYDSSAVGVPQTLAGVAGGVVAQPLVPTPVPVPGDWGETSRTIDSFAMSQSSPAQIAAVTDEGLLIGPVGGAAPSRTVDLPQLLRPQYDSAGNIWAVSSADPAQVSYVTKNGVVPIDTTQLGGMAIRGFQVSPDGRRIILVRQVASGAEDSPLEVGVALIGYENGLPASIGSWQPIRLTWGGVPLNSVIDVAWLGPSSLLVLGSSGTTAPELFFTDLDGLEIDEWGSPQNWDPVQMAVNVTSVNTQVYVLDRGGSIWSYQGSYSWTSAPGPASAIGFPS